MPVASSCRWGWRCSIFIVTMNAGPQLMSTVMEEKMSRISEMLLGSLSTVRADARQAPGQRGHGDADDLLYLAAAYGAAYRSATPTR